MERQPEPPRYFTLEQANRLLPRVQRLLEQLQAQASELAMVQQVLAEGVGAAGAARGPGSNGHAGNGAAQRYLGALQRVDAVLDAMRVPLAELQQIGCELKDIQTGLVDFRTVRDGRAVYLCWRLGEDEIRFWHELDTGFAGRQPL
ncbi:MAG: DUF2203 domain-containing protein [Chloroflexota bacterium]